MSGLIRNIIEGFDLPNGFSFSASESFTSENGRNMLINIKNGTTMLLSGELLSQLEKKEPSLELQFKLVQRGFATVLGSNPIIDQNSSSVPRFVLIDMTNACNLRCRYCFRKPGESKEIISEENIDDILAFLKRYMEENAINELTIQPWGGEPLAAADRILYMIKKSTELGINLKFTIETNGSLMSSELAEILRKNDVKLGISVDGNELIHDAHRPFDNGKGSLQAIKNNIHLLSEAGYSDLSSITVITKDSIDELENIVDYLIDNMKFSDIKLNLMKGTKYNDRELLLSNDDISRFAEKLTDIISRAYRNNTPIVEANICEKMGNLLYRKGDNICISKGCSGGRELISINRKGQIFPCEMTDYPEESLGTIYDGENLRDRIIKASKENDYFSEKRKPECDTCPWWYFCRGGCSSAVKYEHDRICGVDENECALNRVLYPLLVKMILEEPQLAEAIARGK